MILSDGSDPELCRQLFDVSCRLGAVSTVMRVKKSMNDADKNFYMKCLLMPSVIISVMTARFPHQWKKKVQESQNTRLVEVVAFDKHAQRIIAQTSYHRVSAISQKIKDILSIGHQMNITTAGGSDLQLALTNTRPTNQCCPIIKSGDVGELPAGKLCFDVAPETGDGVLVIDDSIAPLGAVSEPVRLKLNGGTIRRISGKKTAAKLQYLFKKNGSISRQLLIVGFGTNEAINPDETTEYGEHVAGNMFFTFGVPSTDKTPSNLLVRAILSQPTVVIDGKTLLEKGRFMMFFHSVRTVDNQRISAVGKNF
ncbi:hypothetical protein KAH55_14500 [bacterium]|nr:hypothetical protein [bacterium]